MVKIIIELPDRECSGRSDSDVLRYVAKKIEEGYEGGYVPYWKIIEGKDGIITQEEREL